MPKNIILNYKDEEKIIHEVPNNFIDLKNFFLSLFDESNDEIYLFRYKRTGKKNKVKIEIKDDLFKENMKEIDQNNTIIIQMNDISEILKHYSKEETFNSLVNNHFCYIINEEEEKKMIGIIKKYIKSIFN